MPDRPAASNLDEVMVVGLGVRHLAESARRGGLRVTAVDAFADEDTASTGFAVRVVDGTAEGLTRAALRLGSPGIGVIFGAGMEGRADLLRRLSRHFRLLGNRPSVAALVADPRSFFGLLDDLQIPHPEIRLSAPGDLSGWLLKRGASCGGAAVRAADAGGGGLELCPDSFYQRRVTGPVVSVLFAADGARAQIVGYNRLFSESRGERPYAYSGATTWGGPNPSARKAVEGYVERLTLAIGLKGINGLDFVLSPERLLVLELNARPTATLELHENRLPGGGVAAHLAACAGRLPEPAIEEHGVVRGYRVVYADRPLTTPTLNWPAWVRDRPRGGERFCRDEPVCTVRAIGSDFADLEDRLRFRSRCLLSMIDHMEIQAA